MKVSVLFPVFNGMPFLKESVRSIRSQAFDDFEVIIVDDGSTDESFHFISDLMDIDDRFRVFRNDKNIGLAATLNKAIKMARGQYLARMDADDFSHPQRLSKQYKEIERGYDLVGCHYQVRSKNGVNFILVPLCRELFPIYLTMTVPFAHGSVMIRKSFLEQHSLCYSNSACEDFILWQECYLKGARFSNVDENLYIYRSHEASYSQTKLDAMLTSKYRDGQIFIESIGEYLPGLVQSLVCEKLQNQEKAIVFSLCLYLWVRTQKLVYLKKVFSMGGRQRLFQGIRYVRDMYRYAH